MVETQPMYYVVSHGPTLHFPLLSSMRPRIIYVIHRLHRYTDTLHTVHYYPRAGADLSTVHSSTRILHQVQSFINISGLPRIESAAPIRLATTDHCRNQLRHRAIHIRMFEMLSIYYVISHDTVRLYIYKRVRAYIWMRYMCMCLYRQVEVYACYIGVGLYVCTYR